MLNNKHHRLAQSPYWQYGPQFVILSAFVVAGLYGIVKHSSAEPTTPTTHLKLYAAIGSAVVFSLMLLGAIVVMRHASKKEVAEKLPDWYRNSKFFTFGPMLTLLGGIAYFSLFFLADIAFWEGTGISANPVKSALLILTAVISGWAFWKVYQMMKSYRPD